MAKQDESHIKYRNLKKVEKEVCGNILKIET